MGSLSSRLDSRRAPARLALAVLASSAVVAVVGCGEEERVAPPAEPEAGPAAREQQLTAPEGAERRDGRAKSAEESGDKQASGPSPETEQIRRRIERRADATRERIEQIREISDRVREARASGELQEVLERLRAGEGPPAEELCRRLGGPDRICAKL